MRERIFVFVVCGSREHIDTLHFSLKALLRYSKCPIIIITDSNRNEIPIEFDRIVDVPTPLHFNHHQASIYLKTGIHSFLSSGPIYCYLDTDVVGLNRDVDSIFDEYISPITFAADHCKINAFSPSAVQCGCIEAHKRDSERIETLRTEEEQNVIAKPAYIKSSIATIDRLVEESKSNSLIYFFHKVKYLLSPTYYHLNPDYKLNKKTGEWYDKNGLLLRDFSTTVIDQISLKTGFNYLHDLDEWQRPDGTSITNLSCNHLVEAIKKKYQQGITPDDWQHWNGGVFLFDASSVDFLDYWHQITMEIFQDPYWKTRDQGTLATTVWKFGLKHHPTLPIFHNFIADYYSTNFEYEGDFQFRYVIDGKTIRPNFIHIYHQWGDTNWQVWNDVERLIHSEC